MTIIFVPRPVNFGLDDHIRPNWQMVPVGGARLLDVYRVPSALPPRVGNPRIIKVSRAQFGDHWTVALDGVAEGRTFIWWPTTEADTALRRDIANYTLEVSVKAQRKVRTAFHYVTDGRRQVTKRRIEDLDKLIVGANAILEPQANVVIVRKSARELSIAQNLGRTVTYDDDDYSEGTLPPGLDEWRTITAHGDPTADFNVFFVKRLQERGSPTGDVNAGTLEIEKDCLFEDRIKNAAETLAHETGHLLGADHGVPYHHLMSGNAFYRTGTFIGKEQANLINRSGT